MARAALQRRLTWRLGRVATRLQETPRVHTIVLDVPDWPGHIPGQHVDIRLTAADGYQAQRSYSISVWEVGIEGPLLLVAGGSGICPLMAMIRHRAARGGRPPTRLLFSSRSLEDVIFREELDRLAGRQDGLEVFHALTRERPDAWPGYARRIDREMLAEVGWSPEDRALSMVCGPTPLVETVARSLVELGNPADRVKTERFGPTGG